MRPWPLAALPLVTLIAGCAPGVGPARSGGDAPPPTGADRIVEVATIVDALKCELARTFADRDYVATLVEPDVTAELELTNVVSSGTEGSVGLGVKPLGISFGPGIKRSSKTKRSNAVTLAFSFTVADRGDVRGICGEPTETVLIAGRPFVTLLDGLTRQIGVIRRGAPLVQFDKVGYKTGFDVERTRDGTVKLDFAIFSLSGGKTIGREAGQQIALTFTINKQVIRPTMPALSPP